jgi:hypothetical protein
MDNKVLMDSPSKTNHHTIKLHHTANHHYPRMDHTAHNHHKTDSRNRTDNRNRINHLLKGNLAVVKLRLNVVVREVHAKMDYFVTIQLLTAPSLELNRTVTDGVSILVVTVTMIARLNR